MTSARKLLEAADAAGRGRSSIELSESAEDTEEVRRAWVDVAVKRLERVERREGGERPSIDDVEVAQRAAIDNR